MNISSPITGKFSAALAALLFVLPCARAWFSGTDAANVESQGLQLVYQGAPPTDDSVVTGGNFDGAPSNWCSTQQIDSLRSTKWTGSAMTVWVWGNRYNFLQNDSSLKPTNTRPNLIAPTFGTSNGAIVRRSEPLAWSSTVKNYQVGELVTYNTQWYQSGTTFSGTTGTPDTDGRWTNVTPIFWNSGSSYANGDIVYTKTSHKWYKSKANSNSSPLTDSTKWTDVTTGRINSPECRIEYGSTGTTGFSAANYAKAIASNIVQTYWLIGRPAYTQDGTGYMDVADAAGLTVFSSTSTIAGAIPPVPDPQGHQLNTQTFVDDNFNNRPVDPTGLGAEGYAVNTNGVYLQIYRLADCWKDYAAAAPWTRGQLIRDDKNLLPNNFWADPVTGNSGTAGYGRDCYTTSITNPAGGGLAPALSATTPITNGSVILTGTNRAVRQRYLVSSTTAPSYRLQVSGNVTVPVNTGTAGKVILQVIGLDATGTAQVGSTVNVNFFPTGTLPFTYTTTFSAPGGPAPTWPGTSAYLRFSVNANSGMTGDAGMTIAISSLTVTNATDSTPSYWRFSGTTTSGTFSPLGSSGTSQFPTFATYRSSSGTANWKQQILGMELDYEVADLRPSSSSFDYTGTVSQPNTDQNAVYLFETLHDALKAEGYHFTVYTNDLDNKADSFGRSVATANSLVDSNLGDVMLNCDHFVSIVDGDNFHGNDIRAALAANYNRMKYYKGVPSGTARPEFDASKVGFAIELLDKYANDSLPIQDITSSGTNNLVTVTAPNQRPIAHAYVRLWGLPSGTLNPLNGTFRVKSGGNPTFICDAKVALNEDISPTDPDQEVAGHYYTEELYLPGNNQPDVNPTCYLPGQGGMVASGGSLVSDFAFARQFLNHRGVTYLELWKNYAVQRPPVSSTPVTGVQLAGGQMIVTTSGSVSGFASKRVYLDGILPDAQNQLNGSSYVAVTTGTVSGTALSATRFLLDGYSGSTMSLSAPSVSGTATEALSHNISEKIQAYLTQP